LIARVQSDSWEGGDLTMPAKKKKAGKKKK